MMISGDTGRFVCNYVYYHSTPSDLQNRRVSSLYLSMFPYFQESIKKPKCDSQHLFWMSLLLHVNATLDMFTRIAMSTCKSSVSKSNAIIKQSMMNELQSCLFFSGPLLKFGCYAKVLNAL